MSRRRSDPPPPVYDTSVSSRGESATSRSSSHDLMTMEKLSTDRRRVEKQYQDDRFTQQSNNSYRMDSGGPSMGKVGTTASWSGGRVDPDHNIVSAVSRYTSNLYNLPNSPRSNVATQSETGVYESNRTYSSRSNFNQESGRPSIPSPLIPYDEAADAAAPDVDKKRSTQQTKVKSVDYDIRDRIRRLQQRKDERNRVQTTKNMVQPNSLRNEPSVESVRKESTNTVGMNHQQKHSTGVTQYTTPRLSKDVATHQFTNDTRQSQPRQIDHVQGETKTQRGRGGYERPSGVSPSSQILKNQSHSRPVGTPNNNIDSKALIRNERQQSTQQQREIMERQRSRSVPGERRIPPKSSQPIPPIYERHARALDNSNDETETSSEFRQLHYQGGRTAEIETPSSARVREIRSKLWSPNEHLLVSVQPSLHEGDDTNLVRMEEQQKDHSRRKFNRHWLHYNGPEMAGNKGQRITRSLSPKSQSERNSLYREVQAQMALNRQQQQDYLHSKTSNGCPATTTPNSVEQKSMIFKSRYYEAAQRGLNRGVSPTRSVSTKTVHSYKSWESTSKPESTSGKGSQNTRDHVLVNQSTTSPRDRTTGSGIQEKNSGTRSTYRNENVYADTGMPQEQKRRDSKSESTSQRNEGSLNANSSDTVASLIAKLGAVQRDNPQAALAQIDAILGSATDASFSGNISDSHEARQFTRNDGGNVNLEGKRTAKADYAPVSRYEYKQGSTGKNEYRSGDVADSARECALVDSDDRGVVTSMQAMEGDMAESSEEDDDSFLDETTVSSMTNPTYSTNTASVNLLDKNGQTASFQNHGRPRPSSLQAYSMPNSYSRLIQMKDESANPREVSSDNNRIPGEDQGREFPVGMSPGTMGEQSKRSSRSRVRSPPPDAINVSFNTTGNVTRRSSGQTGRRRSTESEGVENIEDAPKVSNSRVLPATNETLDENSTGNLPNAVSELSDESHKHQPKVGDSKYQRREYTIPEECANSVVERSLSPSSRRNHPWDSTIPARLFKVDVRDTSMESANGIETTFTSKPKIRGNTISPDRSGISPVRRMRKEIITNERKSPSNDADEIDDSYPWHNENTKAMSEDFDAAWVSLPSSTFFQPKKSQSIANVGVVHDAFDVYNDLVASDPVQSMTKNTTQYEFEQQYSPPKTTNEIVTPISPKNTAKPRGGLRGLLKRKGNTNARSAADKSTYETISNQVPYPDKDQGRNGGRSKSRPDTNSSRGRTKSLDDRRFRSPSIARKFGRLIKVYDTEMEKSEI